MVGVQLQTMEILDWYVQDRLKLRSVWELVASCRTPEQITYMKEHYDPSQYDIENEANSIAECFSANYTFMQCV